MLTQPTLHALEQRKRTATDLSSAFHTRYQAELDAYKAACEEALRDGLDRFEASVASLSQDHPLCADLSHRTAGYVEWMRWALGDLPYFAFAVGLPIGRLRQALPGCALVYFAGRILDDFLDRHHLYRGRRFTLLSELTEDRAPGGEADALTVLMGLLVIIEGLIQTSESDEHVTPQVLRSARGLLVGILMDRSAPATWDRDFYERLIEHKNVDYWRILYDALDPARTSPLYPILARYYALAQKLNDLEDYTRDELQGRPNIVSIYRLELRQTAQDTNAVLQAIETDLAEELLALIDSADSLPETARAIALLKLGETQAAFERIAFFLAPAPAQTPAKLARLGLAWHSNLEEFIQRRGPGALELVPCPACAADRPVPVFRKQGFSFNRCQACTHLYVSPRLRSEWSTALALESSDTAYDPFLETQKIYAESICRTLRHHSTGQRLLDLGHGAGYLMLMARAFGFQTYGVDASTLSSTALQPVFGDRLRVMQVDGDPLPWGSFDQVVMTHVLEHMPEPRRILPAIHAALNPGGILYVAVPDSDSLQFRVFGKNWDAVSPTAHPQFFNEASLSQLLRDTGFEPVLRVRSPRLAGPERKRWMSLFRRLGGDEAGELAIVARRLPQSG